MFALSTCLYVQGQTNFPVLKSIRFNLKGNPQLTWMDPGVGGVYIQRYAQPEGRDYLKIDSVRNVLQYTDTLIKVNRGRVAYNLAPWIANEGYPLSKHTSIELTATYSTCDNHIVCQWKPYMETIYEGSARWAVVSYQIWGRNLQDSTMYTRENENFSLWSILQDTTSEIRVQAPAETPFYQIQMRAINAFGDTATSPCIMVSHRTITLPTNLSLDSIIQQTDSLFVYYQLNADTIEMNWELFLQNQTDSLSIPIEPKVRSLSSIPKALRFPTSNIQNLDRNYRVMLRGKNTCNEVIMQSNSVYTLNIACEQWPTSYHLDWNNHDAPADIHYTVFRSIQNGTFQSIASNITQQEFNDPLTDLLNPPPVGSLPVCYRIHAHYPNGNRVINRISACAIPTQTVHMPNAIAPMRDDYNPVTGKSRNRFEPVGISIAEFHLLIVDRNGKIIYSGTEPWNGKQNNNANFVLEGSYSYRCKIRFFDYSKKTLSGTLTVVY